VPRDAVCGAVRDGDTHALVYTHRHTFVVGVGHRLAHTHLQRHPLALGVAVYYADAHGFEHCVAQCIGVAICLAV
jgi:hypothetical protein